jgi:hypothetical protein
LYTFHITPFVIHFNNLKEKNSINLKTNTFYSMSLDTNVIFPDLEEGAQMHSYTHPGSLSTLRME